MDELDRKLAEFADQFKQVFDALERIEARLDNLGQELKQDRDALADHAARAEW